MTLCIMYLDTYQIAAADVKSILWHYFHKIRLLFPQGKENEQNASACENQPHEKEETRWEREK